MCAMKIAIIGFGKIAREEHAPAIAGNDAFTLVAAVGRSEGPDGLPCFGDFASLLRDGPAFDAVSICLPPYGRFKTAAAALVAGKHVLLEKPPGATLGEVAQLKVLAAENSVSLFTSWHSRYAPGIDMARAHLAVARIHQLQLTWSEDVRIWHPDQQWIWQAGGLGVFDTGINGLALATAVLPHTFTLTSARLHVPRNHLTPIAAELDFIYTDDTRMNAVFNWDHSGPDDKALIAETEHGNLRLDKGGERLFIDGRCLIDAPQREYEALYRDFERLIAAGESTVDVVPLAHVADAFMLGTRFDAPEFHG